MSTLKKYNGDKIVKDKAENRSKAQENYDRIFEKNLKAKKPNLSLDKVDPSQQIQGLNDEEKRRINGYKRRL